MIALNKNEDVKLMNKVASGGELSRMMLGLKSIFSSLEGVETLIFDEIDSGVSGIVATSIGLKMAEISRNIQVFSITHLAQVASFADHHYYVYKVHDDTSTKTNIKLLSNIEILNEISMISNSNTNESSIKAASELYHYSQNLKLHTK